MKAGAVFLSRPSNWPFEEIFLPDLSLGEWLQLIPVALEKFFNGRIFHLPNIPSGLHIEGSVYLDSSVKLPPYGFIKGPAYIGPETELRPGVYIRGNVIVGSRCVLGNSCEYKHALLMDEVQTPHFNYVGDSILGYRSHLGAGVILSNVRFDKEEIYLRSLTGQKQETKLRKVGAYLGDYAEVGCNGVLQPGSILYPRAKVYPGVVFGGTLAEGNEVRSTLALIRKV